MSINERVTQERVPHWICPDCQTIYFGASSFRFCPKCADKKLEAQTAYWDNERARLKIVADGILAKYLNNGTQSGTGRGQD